MYKSRIAFSFGAFLLLIAACANDAAAETREPLNQAKSINDTNLKNKPVNKSTRNASKRLKTNQERHEKKSAQQEAKHKTQNINEAKTSRKKSETTPKHENSGHPEKMERLRKDKD